MPKIMFRPNPTPPPFPPPSPSYDTHYYAQSLKEYYDSENPIALKFSPCSYPEFLWAEILVVDERVAYLYGEDLSTDDFQTWECGIPGSVPFQGTIKFYASTGQEEDKLLHSATIDVTFAG